MRNTYFALRVIALLIVIAITSGFGIPKNYFVCMQYADDSVHDNNSNLAFGCGLAGPEWSSDRDYHYGWCSGLNLSDAQIKAYMNDRLGDAPQSPIGQGKSYRANLLARCGAAYLEGSLPPRATTPIDSVCYLEKTAICLGPYLPKAAYCYGDYCSNIRFSCCRYTKDGGPLVLDSFSKQLEGGYSSNRWLQWFSEELPNNFSVAKGFIKELFCKGDHCDNISLREVIIPDLPNVGQCYWTRSFSEEFPHSSTCDRSEFIAGARCTGSYCDNVELYCCRAQLK